MSKRERSRTFDGLSVADGVSVGRARVVSSGYFPAEVPRHSVPEGDLHGEVRRFRRACSRAAEDVQELADRIERELGSREAGLIRPQALMAEDPDFVSRVEGLIREEHCNAEAAVSDVIHSFERMISSFDDPYLRERSADVRDAGRRVLGRLLFSGGELMPRLPEPSVVVSEHLVPSLTVHLDRENILGFATEQGGYTSHAAILARSIGVPAVTGLEGLTEEVVDGHEVIVDGIGGKVIVNPTEARLEEYSRKAEKFWARRREVIEEADRPSVTLDGESITVRANIGRPEEAERVLEYQAAGVGLYRTEFEYLSQTALPTEDELTTRYSAIADDMGDRGVVFRVLDIGGDKFPPAVPLAHEENPFLGLRGLRLLLEHVEDIALPQIKAILRAGRRGRVRILYPMVASAEDLETMLEVAERAREELGREAGDDPPEVEQGVMIEVPSSVTVLPELLERCDFASVGTNDLVQYVLAADRNSERMARAYDPFHPAVLRILEDVLRVGQRMEKEISVCGEVAGDTHFLPLLLGLGCRTLSVNVGAVPYVKRAVRRVSLEDCRHLAQKALRAGTARRARRLADEFYRERVRDSERNGGNGDD